MCIIKKKFTIFSANSFWLKFNEIRKLFFNLEQKEFFFNRVHLGHGYGEDWYVDNLFNILLIYKNSSIFRLDFTFLEFRRALLFLYLILKERIWAQVLIVSGVKASKNINLQLDKRIRLLLNLDKPFILRWCPGFLTNFNNFYECGHALIQKSKPILTQVDYLNWEGFLRLTNSVPHVIIFLSVVGAYQVAVKEANLLNIPTIGIIDSNASMDSITYFIHGNDDSSLSTLLYLKLFKLCFEISIAAGQILHNTFLNLTDRSTVRKQRSVNKLMLVETLLKTPSILANRYWSCDLFKSIRTLPIYQKYAAESKVKKQHFITIVFDYLFSKTKSMFVVPKYQPAIKQAKKYKKNINSTILIHSIKKISFRSFSQVKNTKLIIKYLFDKLRTCFLILNELVLFKVKIFFPRTATKKLSTNLFKRVNLFNYKVKRLYLQRLKYLQMTNCLTFKRTKFKIPQLVKFISMNFRNLILLKQSRNLRLNASLESIRYLYNMNLFYQYYYFLFFQEFFVILKAKTIVKY